MSEHIGFLENEIGRQAPDQCLFQVFPVPYEKTVSYGRGTANGPAAILAASQKLELFDGLSTPAQSGIHTHPVIDCSGADAAVLGGIADIIGRAFSDGKIPVALGGEHTITHACVIAAARRYPSVGVLQFDAHADLRDTYTGTRLSHGCVMKRIIDDGVPIVQIGVRSLSEGEHELRSERGICHYDADRIYRERIFSIDFPADFPEHLYITVDVDALDPSLMPATGTPEPGGLFWHDFFHFLESIPASKKIVGFDVVEFAPIAGMHAPDFTAARLVYNMMGIIARRS